MNITTRLSDNGNVIIPEIIRNAYGWGEGLEFIVTDTGNGILLRPLEHFQETKIEVEDVLGCTGYKGPKKSLKDMEDAIAKRAEESRLWKRNTN